MTAKEVPVATPPRRRFFTAANPWPTRYSQPRSLSASAARIGPAKDHRAKRPTSAWQAEAWRYAETIGEVKFAFDMVAALVSRVRLYAAVVDDPDMVPVEASLFLDSIHKAGLNAEESTKVIRAAQEVVSDLMLHSQGLGSGFLRDIATNLQIAGEVYVVSHENRWIAVSSDSLKPVGEHWKVQTDRSNSKDDIELPEDTFVARIWKPSARYSAEPTSSMVGVLDACEALVLLDQAMRAMTRTRLGAGIIFIPDGITVATGDDVEEVLIEATTQPITDETAATSVVPLMLKGPVELGKEIRRIDLARPIDDTMITMSDRLMNRILTGLDVPKDIVTGLADTRYANALIVTDDLFRTSVEPLVLLICDALTQAVLRPAMRKALVGEGDKDVPALADHIIIWFDPSDAVTRPDKSQAANDGWDRGILSAESWRASRGFTQAVRRADPQMAYGDMNKKPTDKAVGFEGLDRPRAERRHPEARAYPPRSRGLRQWAENPGDHSSQTGPRPRPRPTRPARHKSRPPPRVH